MSDKHQQDRMVVAFCMVCKQNREFRKRGDNPYFMCVVCGYKTH